MRLALILVLLLPAAAVGHARSSIPLPDSLEEVSAMVGFERPPDRSRFLLDLTRFLHAEPAGRHLGIDAIRTELAVRLAEAAGGGPTVPLPLSPGTWSAVILEAPVAPERLATTILTDRSAALLYHGLSGMSDETLDYLETRPELLRRLYREHAAILAPFGRSFEVREDGTLGTPGGESARARWSHLVGRDPSEPELFLPELLGRDAGKMALFYDALANLDERKAAIVLGQGSLEALYDAFAKADDAIDLTETPFRRRGFDAASLLREVVLDDGGQLVLPKGLRLWESDTGTATLAWLVSTICHAPAQTRRERFETLLFAQRVFRGASTEDAADVAVALDGFVRYRTLLATMERMGLTTPSTYAAAARRAESLSSIGNDRRAAVALTQFQGAFALIERAQTRATLTTSQAEELTLSLIAVELERDRYRGAIASWIDHTLVPTLRSASRSPANASVEDTLLMALAGAPETTTTRFEWEGLELRLSYRDAELRRLRELREAQGGNHLGAVLALSRVIETPGDDPQLSAIRETLVELPDPGVEHAPTPPVLARVFERTAAKRRRDPGDLSLLAELTDELTADVLRSLVYAIHLGEVDGPIFVTERLAARHDLGVTVPLSEYRERTPWKLPAEVSEERRPWHVRGSLLGMDLGLSRLGLRRLEGAPPRRAPKVLEADREGFSQAVALMKPHELRDADRDRIAGAIAQGRVRVAGLSETDALAIARDAGLSGWRRHIMPWVAAHDPDRVAESFRLVELYTLGARESSRTPAYWGTSALAETGCFCLRIPSSESPETALGRPGLFAARIPDASLLVAERLAEWRIPASLAPAVLSYLVLDLVERARPNHDGDWHALTHDLSTYPPSRLEDYISALAVRGGPLHIDAGRVP